MADLLHRVRTLESSGVARSRSPMRSALVPADESQNPGTKFANVGARHGSSDARCATGADHIDGSHVDDARSAVPLGILNIIDRVRGAVLAVFRVDGFGADRPSALPCSMPPETRRCGRWQQLPQGQQGLVAFVESLDEPPQVQGGPAVHSCHSRQVHGCR